MTDLKRILRALASALLIAAIVGGGGWLLVRFGRLSHLWTMDWSQILSRPDDGSLLLAVITLIGWIAWIWITLSFVSEALAAATGQRRRLSFPGSELLAPLSAVLIAAIAGLVASGTAAAPPDPGAIAPAQPRAPVAPIVADATPTQAPGDDAGQQVAPPMHTHVVQPGDDLWSLAERYYGDGAKWREIAAANHTSLLVSTDHLTPGMTLAIPDLGQPAAEPSVVVQPGQTLSELSAEHLGDAARWPELMAANPAIIADPDLIDAGWRLRLPDSTQLDEPSQPDNSSQADGSPQADGSFEADGSSQADESSQQDQPSQADEPSAVNPDDTEADQSDQSAEPAPGSSGEQSSTDDDAVSDLQLCPIPEPGSNSGGSADRPIPAGQRIEADQPGQHAGIAALGAAATTILASTFLVRRRQQLAKRPIGHAVPRLGPDARSASIALAHAACETPSSASSAIAGTIDQIETAPSVEHSENADTEIALGLLADARSETADRELYYDVEKEQVTWLHGPADLTAGMAAAMGLALLASPANQVVVAGSSFGWLADLEEPRLEVRPCVEQACRWLDDLAARRAANRDADSSLDLLRGDPLVAEAWSPVVLIVDSAPERLPRRFSGLGLSMIVCTAATRSTDGTSSIRVADGRAVYLPTAEVFVPHLVGGPARRALTEIFEVAAATDYPVAPWWATHETADLPIVLPTAIRSGSVEGGTVSPLASTEHPMVKLLGTIELVGAQGAPPPRAIKQCIEYCAWLLENPGGTAAMMSDDLMVAEATRRSNMSRLRSWLGNDEHGAAYLPDAYSGRIALHPGITSDWELLQSLLGGGVNRVASISLVHALELVQGAPLADAAPGQWHWAEQLRQDMVATICDIAVELARRGLAAGDLDSAQWAIERGLAAGSEDEHLAAAQIQLAHLRKDEALVDQLVMQLTRRTRSLGIDLSDETVTLLQEVVEGRARLRQA